MTTSVSRKAPGYVSLSGGSDGCWRSANTIFVVAWSIAAARPVTLSAARRTSLYIRPGPSPNSR